MTPLSLDIVRTVATVIGTCFTGIGLVIAIKGLSTWRRQLKGSSEYELAKRLMLAAYKLRESIRSMRRPFMFNSEAKGGPTDVPWEVAAYDNRWKEVDLAVAELNSITLEAEVIWGKTAQTLKKNLLSHLGLLRSAVFMFNQSKIDESFRQDYTKEHRDVLYEVSEDDDYNVQLSRLLQKYESFVKPHLHRPITTHKAGILHQIKLSADKLLLKI